MDGILPLSGSPLAIRFSLAGGAGGTGKMISEAIFHSFATFIQLMTIRNGLGVPSCPAYDTAIVIGA